MQPLLLSSLIFLLVMLVYLLAKWKSTNYIIVFLCTCIILYFITFPKQCISSTIYGAKIFFTAVFPSLFPFLIICNLLIRYDGITIYSKLLGKMLCRPLRLPIQCSLAIIISALCGYPLGAKYCCDIYENKLISRANCQRLLNIASNTSPLFIVGSVATAMLGNTQLGYLILFSNYISCIIMSFLIKPIDFHSSIKGYQINPIPQTSKRNFGGELKESIENALKTTLSIGGYIVFFAVLIDIISYNKYFDILLQGMIKNRLLRDTIKFTILGMIELTKGCQLISTLSISLYFKGMIISFLAAFSGLSIISQVYSFTYKFPELSMKIYIKRKAVQGIVSSLVTALLFIPYNKLSIGAFSTLGQSFTPNWLYIFILTILFIPFCVQGLKRLLHVS